MGAAAVSVPERSRRASEGTPSNAIRRRERRGRRSFRETSGDLRGRGRRDRRNRGQGHRRRRGRRIRSSDRSLQGGRRALYGTSGPFRPPLHFLSRGGTTGRGANRNRCREGREGEREALRGRDGDLPVPAAAVLPAGADDEAGRPDDRRKPYGESGVLFARLLGEPDTRAAVELDQELALLETRGQLPGDRDRAARSNLSRLQDNPSRTGYGREGECGEESDRENSHGSLPRIATGSSIGKDTNAGGPDPATEESRRPRVLAGTLRLADPVQRARIQM